jgi:hypothetical protein
MVKFSLGLLQELQDEYRRSGKAVDAELRSAYPKPPSQFQEDQEEVVARCLELEANSAAAGLPWVSLKSPPLVNLWMQPEVSERSIAVCKAECVLDAPALQALAWWAMQCSRLHTKISKDDGHPARVILYETSPHDVTWATVKSSPFPLRRREFVGRQVTCKEQSGSLVLAFEPLSSKTQVDYGRAMNAVRGSATGFLRFTPLDGNTQCKLTLYQRLDAGGRVPVAVMNRTADKAMAGVGSLREAFQRDAEIDAGERDLLAPIIRADEQNYEKEEDELVNRVRDLFLQIPDAVFKDFLSPDRLVKMEGDYGGGASGVPKATTIIDADICMCASWELLKMARHFMKSFYGGGGMERSVNKVNDHNFVTQIVFDYRIPTFKPREFVQRVVWRWEDATTLLVAAESCSSEAHPVRPSFVRGSASVLAKFEQVVSIGEIPQTRLTWFQQPDLGGRIPKKLVDRAAVSQMMYASRMRKAFDKSKEVDAASMAGLVDMIRAHEGDYTNEEILGIDAGKDRLKMFERMKTKNLQMESPSTEAKVAFKDNDSHAWGRATTTVRAE